MHFKHEGCYYEIELDSTNTTFLMPDGVTMGALVTERDHSSLTFSWMSYPDFVKEDIDSRAAYLRLPVAQKRWILFESAESIEKAVRRVNNYPESVVMVRELVSDQAMFVVADPAKRDFLMELLDDVASYLDVSFTISSAKFDEVFTIGVRVVDITELFWNLRFAQNGEWGRVRQLLQVIPPPEKWRPRRENDYDG